MHSPEYTGALEKISARSGCTDIRELLRLIPECFEGVARVDMEIVNEKSGMATTVSAFVEKKKVVFTNSPDTGERFVRTKVPMTVRDSEGEKTIGTMQISSFYPLRLNEAHPNDGQETRKVLGDLASLVGKTIDARLDGLTALPVRKYFEADLKRHEAAFAAGRRNFTLIILDIDTFKSINDGYGHPAGDFVLANIARILHNGIRARPDRIDGVCRIGGEEFALLLPDVPREEGVKIAERIRMEIQDHVFALPFLPFREIRVTCSFGVADANEAMSGARGDDQNSGIYQLADSRLMAAKRDGRNRVVPEPEQAIRLSA